MVHGNPTWSIYYRNLINLLKPNHRCIVPDHIGCGLSDKPGATEYSFTLQERIQDLTSLLDHLNIHNNITLIVHDWGGMIGMAYASMHPDAIKKMVILNTAAFHLPKPKKFPAILRFFRTSIGKYLILRHNLFAWGASQVSCSKTRMPRALRKAYCAPYNTSHNRLATLKFVQDIPISKGDVSYDLISQIENNLALLRDKPTLICWGMKDFIFDEHFLKVWESRFPEAEVHRFPDGGHYILEDYRDKICELTSRFLS
ncbi:Uncharacterized protein SCG7086_AQ_00120 [Chlamydiales bacterium SCGC AG-110-P3]|nr:Uncharacterized protein SCG7086_AQ_00120 [Chlamydiales bacterium SCGC AG-110-P3]